MGDTKRKLMENFDDEVRNRLRLREEEARSLRSVHEKSLYYLTKHLLGSLARFDDPTWTFEYQGCRYGFDAAQPGIDHLYRPGLPLAQQMLMSARGLCTPEALLEFQMTERTTSALSVPWPGSAVFSQPRSCGSRAKRLDEFLLSPASWRTAA